MNSHDLSIGATADDLEWPLKVIWTSLDSTFTI